MLKQVVQGIHDVSRISTKCRRNVNGKLAIVAPHVVDLTLLTETVQEMIDLKATLAALFLR